MICIDFRWFWSRPLLQKLSVMVFSPGACWKKHRRMFRNSQTLLGGCSWGFKWVQYNFGILTSICWDIIPLITMARYNPQKLVELHPQLRSHQSPQFLAFSTTLSGEKKKATSPPSTIIHYHPLHSASWRPGWWDKPKKVASPTPSTSWHWRSAPHRGCLRLKVWPDAVGNQSIGSCD